MDPSSFDRRAFQTSKSTSSDASFWTEAEKRKQGDQGANTEGEVPLGDPRDISHYLDARPRVPQIPEKKKNSMTTSKDVSKTHDGGLPPPSGTTGFPQRPVNRSIGGEMLDWDSPYTEPPKTLASGKKNAALAAHSSKSAKAVLPTDEQKDDDEYYDEFSQYDKYYGDDLEVVKGKKCFRKK